MSGGVGAASVVSFLPPPQPHAKLAINKEAIWIYTFEDITKRLGIGNFGRLRLVIGEVEAVFGELGEQREVEYIFHGHDIMEF